MGLGIFSCALVQASQKCSYKELQEYFEQNEIGNVDVDYNFTKKRKANGNWTSKFAKVNNKTMKDYPAYKFKELKGMCEEIKLETFSFTCTKGEIELNSPSPPLKRIERDQ